MGPLASPARRKGFTPGVGGVLPLCSDDVVVCIARCMIIRDKMPHDVESGLIPLMILLTDLVGARLRLWAKWGERDGGWLRGRYRV